MSDLDGFAAWLEKRGRGRSAAQYSKVVGRWLDDPRTVDALMTSTEASPNYRRHLIACVRVWAQYAGDAELMLRLSDIRRPPPTPKDVREPYDFEDWVMIREAIDEAPYLDDATRHVCALVALRGIRCGDVLRLTRRDISRAIDTGTLAYEGKGGRWQNYSAAPLMPYLEGLLALRWVGKRVRNLVCPGSSESRAQESAGRTIRRAFDRIAEELELVPEDLYAHRFRHTYATYFLQQMAGDPEAIFKLQQQMGWARLDTAANYLRRGRRQELDAIEATLLSGRKP